MAMLVRRQQRRVFLQTPIVLKVWLYSAFLAPCLAPATIASREGGSETAAIAQGKIGFCSLPIPVNMVSGSACFSVLELVAITETVL